MVFMFCLSNDFIYLIVSLSFLRFTRSSGFEINCFIFDSYTKHTLLRITIFQFCFEICSIISYTQTQHGVNWIVINCVYMCYNFFDHKFIDLWVQFTVGTFYIYMIVYIIFRGESFTTIDFRLFLCFLKTK